MATIKVEKFIQALPAEVYHYFTNSTAIRDWMCIVATLQPHPGGHIYLSWPGEYYTSGEFIQLEKDKSVSFTWLGRNEPHQTRVDITLKKKKGGTLLKLAHRGIGRGKKWESIADTYAKEWQKSLENLVSVLETGADLRITKRPMLGIYIDEFTPEIAAQLHVPAEYGVRLSDVIDGMGAKKAGLRKDDVIVALNDHVLSTTHPISSILSLMHAGDEVNVTFYRGAEKKMVKMTLSGRAIPPTPSSAAELSKQAALIYHRYETEFESIISSASESECSHKPGPAEWSVNEIMAHLIHSELGWQNYLGEIVTGHEASYDDYFGNLQARIDGTTAVFTTKDDLFRQLKAHNAETLAIYAHLPDDVVTHKGRLWKLAFQANENAIHLQIHLEQIQAAIQSSRQA